MCSPTSSGNGGVGGGGEKLVQLEMMRKMKSQPDRESARRWNSNFISSKTMSTFFFRSTIVFLKRKENWPTKRMLPNKSGPERRKLVQLSWNNFFVAKSRATETSTAGCRCFRIHFERVWQFEMAPSLNSRQQTRVHNVAQCVLIRFSKFSFSLGAHS